LALALTTLPSPVAAQNEILAEIPIELRGNRVIIPVSVGSSGPHRLILDTGMAYDGITLFDTASVDLSQFDHLARVQIRGAGPGGAAHALSDSAATFRAGPRTFKDQRVTMLTGGAFRGFPTDGVIGYSILGHHVVEIDYDTERMILYDPETFSPTDDWVSVDIYFKDNRIPWTDIYVATEEEEEDPVRLSSYIDFAAEEALELLDRDTNVFIVPAETREVYAGRGLSGDIYGAEGRVSRVIIGPYQLEDVLVVVVPAEIRSRQEGADAIIGSGLLRRFNVTFDYSRSRILLSCQVGPPDPEAGERVDTAGS
jgi:hypothetical protein